jgi:hypothetical protein
MDKELGDTEDIEALWDQLQKSRNSGSLDDEEVEKMVSSWRRLRKGGDG